MNWYIGQEVVCVDDENSRLQKGKIYDIQKLQKAPCSCGHIHIGVGILPITSTQYCSTCGYVFPVDSMSLYRESRFRPLQTAPEEADMKEAIEESLCEPATL